MNHASITPTDNGPYLVQGTVTLLGASATTPFCDGSHEKTYFKAVNRAPTNSPFTLAV